MSQTLTRLAFQLVAVVAALIIVGVAAMGERHHLVTTAHREVVRVPIVVSNMKDALGGTPTKVLLEFTEDQVRVTEIPQV
tara:strand:- start:226 stop:465 length:240 start_codon:yes stop_codon:yes gene_type:complete